MKPRYAETICIACLFAVAAAILTLLWRVVGIYTLAAVCAGLAALKVRSR